MEQPFHEWWSHSLLKAGTNAISKSKASHNIGIPFTVCVLEE
jgi:hypothetical protein